MTKKKPVTNNVTISIKKGAVTYRDVEFKAKKGGNLIGTLKVSQGTVDWQPSGSKKNWTKLPWDKFDEVMNDYQKRHKE